jgi:hypothetical protein
MLAINTEALQTEQQSRNRIFRRLLGIIEKNDQGGILDGARPRTSAVFSRKNGNSPFAAV